MRRDVPDTVGYLIIATIVFITVTFLGYVYGHSAGRKYGRCDVRWEYAKTPEDTIRNFKQGCEMPAGPRT